MILKEPYEFRSLKLVNNSSLVSDINRYITISYAYISEKQKIKIKPFTNTYVTLNPVILYGLSDVEKEIPAFHHPIVNLEHKWIALDLRPYISLSYDKESYTVRNESEYELAILRFILSGMWYTGKQSTIYNLKLSHFAFSAWLSDNLTRKFGLDLNNQLQLRVLSSIYYSHLFTDNYTSEDFAKLIIRSQEDVLVPKIIEEIYQRVERLDSLDDFCKACYDVTNNIRVKGLDYTALVNIFSNNWSGSNSKEVALLSLEHPPTWISLVYASLTQRSFKKNFIATVVDRFDKRGKGEDFIKEISSIIKEYKE